MLNSLLLVNLLLFRFLVGRPADRWEAAIINSLTMTCISLLGVLQSLRALA